MVEQMIKTIYKATIQKSGMYWAISVPEIAGLYSQTLSRETVAEMTREAIAFWFEVDPHDFDIELVFIGEV
jgi:predicted RNase H-like HicB family nuclease